MSETKKTSWPTLGSIREGKNKKTGETFRYLKIDDSIAIFQNGKEITLNESRTVNLVNPVSEVERMIASGVIGEDKAESRLAQVKEASSWLKYNLVAPPPKNT